VLLSDSSSSYLAACSCTLCVFWSRLCVVMAFGCCRSDSCLRATATRQQTPLSFCTRQIPHTYKHVSRALPPHRHPSARSRRCPLVLVLLVPCSPCPIGSRCRLPLSRRHSGSSSSMLRSSPLPFAACLRTAGTGRSLVVVWISLGGEAGGCRLSTWERLAGRVRAAAVNPGLSKLIYSVADPLIPSSIVQSLLMSSKSANNSRKPRKMQMC
jgi:hypothetical protein